jgi:hypothetical protein
MTATHVIEVYQGFDLNPFTADGNLSPVYWRGAVRCGAKTIARTKRYKTRKGAERAAAKLLKVFEVAA